MTFTITEAVSDFNGDATSDILLFNQTTGAVGIDTMQSGGIAGWTNVGTADPTLWKVAGVGDFTGNGTADILLFNQTTGAALVRFHGPWRH